MTPESLSSALLWAAAINFGVLTTWFLVFTLAHEQVYRLHRRWFRLVPETFDAVHYAGMALYKIATVMFCLVPWLALRLAA